VQVIWLLWIGYAAGVVFSWRSFVMGLLESFEREFPNSFDNSDRAIGAFMGSFLALAWPVSHLIRSGWRLIINKGILRTSNEIRAAEKAELEAYRKLAQEHNLRIV
jgi:hypothetical protein